MKIKWITRPLAVLVVAFAAICNLWLINEARSEALTMCRAATSAPHPSNGTSVALSCDTNGRLRTNQTVTFDPDVPIEIGGDALTALQGIYTDTTALKGYLDGLEALITSTNGYTDGLETLLTATNTYVDGLETLTGAVTETAPASDTASSGVNGRLQRIAQRVTSLIALVPASLGSKAAASSFAVTDSTEDIARMGIITETAPASDTASSGLNGRLQRIAQNQTTIAGYVDQLEGYTDGLEGYVDGLEALVGTTNTSLTTIDGRVDGLEGQTGIVTETAPASDTASSGLNGRLQRIAQRLTTLIAVFPTTIDTNSGVKSASTLRVVLATDQPALTNKLLVTPDSVALPANQSVNVAQLAGTTTDTNSGTKSAGTIRVVIATDQPALTNKLLVTPDAGSTVQSIPATTGGLSSYVVEAAASDNHVVIKAGAGTLYHVLATTKHTAAQYMRLYNATTGFNGCNSATNLKWEGIIPASSTGSGLVEDIAMGLDFATGISICITGAFGQTDTTNATASVTAVNVFYK